MAAEAIAATVVTILLTVLALNPVGLIISAVLGVIDFLLNLICELGVKDLQKVPGQEGTCFTLTGTITKYLTKLIYSYDVMVSLDRSDLMLTSAPQVTLADPAKGFVGGNSLSVGMIITTTAVHKDPDPNNGVLIYPYMYVPLQPHPQRRREAAGGARPDAFAVAQRARGPQVSRLAHVPGRTGHRTQPGQRRGAHAQPGPEDPAQAQHGLCSASLRVLAGAGGAVMPSPSAICASLRATTTCPSTRSTMTCCRQRWRASWL
jgi:hypothetical protein